MTLSPLTKKLHIRPGSTVALFNAPAGVITTANDVDGQVISWLEQAYRASDK